MTAVPAVACPMTDQVQAGKLRDVAGVELAQLGHDVTWTKGHGVCWLNPDPGWRGVCIRCGGLVRVARYDGSDYRVHEGAMTEQDGIGPRKCNRGIRTP